jgi:hypothetical protein
MKISRVALIALFFFLLSSKAALAGFGITPPYVKNDSLARESVYDQKIVISRSDPLEDLKAEISVNVPGANEWIQIDKGLSFVLPKGETQVPMHVSVHVPKKAKFGEYVGNVRIVLSPSGPPTPGTVGISLGAQIDVAFSVVDKKIYDFKIRQQSVEDVVEGHKFLWFFFPGKIRFAMQVQNLGNVPFGPTKVVMNLKDNAGENILETTKNTNRIDRVKPYQVESVTAELPTHLPPGSYQAEFLIYKNDEIAGKGELSLSVLPYGTLKGYRGYLFFGLTLLEQIEVVAILLGLSALLGGIGWFVTHKLRRSR